MSGGWSRGPGAHMQDGDGAGKAPVVILTQNSAVTSGVEVQQKLVGAAVALGNILRRTYGPRGLDKMLYKSNGETAITNDGAKIISELMVKHPAAKAFISLGNAQESAIGDGVTGCILFAAELMQEAGRLLDKSLHPLILIEGYSKALHIAIADLESNSSTLDSNSLLHLARTAMTGKVTDSASEHLAILVVEALDTVSRTEAEVVRCSSEDVQLAKAGEGSLADSRLIRGLIIERRTDLDQATRALTNASVATITCPLQMEKTSRDAEIEVEDPEQLMAFLDAEETALKEKATTLLNSGARAIFTDGEVDKRVLHTLVDAGCFVLSNIDRTQLERISAATGSSLIDHLNDLDPTDLGEIGSLCVGRLETDEGTSERVIIDDCPSPGIVTIEVGGGNYLAAEETIRAIHDALRATAEAVKDERVSIGGGNAHGSAALAVRTAAESEAGRSRLAMEAFARALEVTPSTLAENAGADSLDRLLELRSEILVGNRSGIIADGTVGEVDGVLEPTFSLIHSWQSATEAVNGLLRVDQVISARGD